MVSVLFHGLALTMALGFMAQAKPVVPKEAFQWDVALVVPQLVQDTRPADSRPTPQAVKPPSRPVAPAPSQPQIVTPAVQPREVTPVEPREIRQVVETSQPMQQRIEAVTPIREPQPAEVPQANQAVVESVTPVAQPETAPQRVTTAASVHPVDARTIETASVLSDAKPTESVAQESAPQVAMATRPNPAVKADYGWLAESLRRKLAEIKRYPSAARLNGWEGKVVVRAVIRADGHLLEVKVHRSSGHEVLDDAAMEAVRLICPLHMTGTMGAAEVAVYVPIVYSLGG